MNARICLCILGLLGLAACAAGPYVERPDNNIYAQTSALRGKPLNDAIILMGNPTGQYTKGEVTTYVWQRRAASSVLDNFTGGAVTRGRGAQVGGTISGMAPVRLTGMEYYRCTVKAETVNRQITKIWTEDNVGGCRYVYDRSPDARLGFESLR